MKIATLGDLHGKTIWKEIVENELDSSDKIIFIGDYFDDHKGTTADHQINNFKEIIELKKQHPEKIVLLLGNHDFHYMMAITDRYSGYQAAKALDIQEAIEENKKYLQLCYFHENIIFSHAGVTKTWCESIEWDENNKISPLRTDRTFEDQINDIFRYQSYKLKFTSGKTRSPYGDDVTQSPIWVRPTSLQIDKVDGYIQVVGHTQQSNIKQIGDIWLIDALHAKEYLSYVDSEFTVTPLPTPPPQS